MSYHAQTADRTEAVLVIVDVQERLAVTMERRDAVLAAAEKLVETSALLGMPIVATRQYPAGLGDTEPRLASAIRDAKATTIVLEADKVSFDCFGEPAFTEAVALTGRHQLLIAGMESHICVVQTALSGLERGHSVHVVADACCSRSADAHELALARLRAAGAVVTTTEAVLYELVGAAGTDEFRELLRIVKGRRSAT